MVTNGTANSSEQEEPILTIVTYLLALGNLSHTRITKYMNPRIL